MFRRSFFLPLLVILFALFLTAGDASAQDGTAIPFYTLTPLPPMNTVAPELETGATIVVSEPDAPLVVTEDTTVVIPSVDQPADPIVIRVETPPDVGRTDWTGLGYALMTVVTLLLAGIAFRPALKDAGRNASPEVFEIVVAGVAKAFEYAQQAALNLTPQTRVDDVALAELRDHFDATIDEIRAEREQLRAELAEMRALREQVNPAA